MPVLIDLFHVYSVSYLKVSSISKYVIFKGDWFLLLIGILPYKGRIVDSVLLWENKGQRIVDSVRIRDNAGQRKPVFWHVLRSECFLLR